MSPAPYMADAQKALVALHEHLAATLPADYAARFGAAYEDAKALPLCLSLPVMMGQSCALLEHAALALRLPNDIDGTAEDALLLTM